MICLMTVLMEIFLSFSSIKYIIIIITNNILFKTIQGCFAVGTLLNVPALVVLAGVEGLLSFAMAHAQVEVPNTLWHEPGILWLAIGMPTGI